MDTYPLSFSFLWLLTLAYDFTCTGRWDERSKKVTSCKLNKYKQRLQVIVEGCLVYTHIYIPKGGVASVLLVCHPLSCHREECQYEVEHLYVQDDLWCEKPRKLWHYLVSATDQLRSDQAKLNWSTESPGSMRSYSVHQTRKNCHNSQVAHYQLLHIHEGEQSIGAIF